MHTSRPGTIPGEFVKYCWSVLTSQARPDICTIAVPVARVVVGVVAVVIVVAVVVAVVVVVAVEGSVVVLVTVSDLLKATAFADTLVAVHAVLAWLHHLLP